MEPVRKVLEVPDDPRREWAVLVILVERGEVRPLRVAAHDLRHARFEIDPEAFPYQQEKARTRWRARFAPSGSPSRRREEHRNESRLQQHSIGLVAGKILRRTDEREEAHETNRQHAAWPEIQDQ